MCCKECGGPLDPSKKAVAVFCSPTCKSTFNNRRAMRGSELYDLWMTLRYERHIADVLHVFSVMCRLGQQYRKEDRQRGHDGTSWHAAKDVIARRPWLTGSVGRS